MRNTEKLRKLVQWMQARKMEDSTINIYQSILKRFFISTDKDSTRISANDVQNYILNIPDRYSDSFRNQVVNALKMYFRVIEEREFKLQYTPRPKGQKYIPEVLTAEEIDRLIPAIRNIKHRAIIYTILDNGLRISELINLQVMDVRTKCEVPHLIIRKAKHHSAREIPLSLDCIEILRQYYRTYKPQSYLFEGADRTKQYSVTSIRNILHRALKDAEINKRIRVHDLRHTFATILLENGTNLKHLSKALGHKNESTTEKYYEHMRPGTLKLIRRTYALQRVSSSQSKLRVV